MNIFSSIASIFTGGGDSALSTIANEWIDTAEEKATANALMIKTLDPNGKMRRDIARTTSGLYVYYLLTTSLLIFLHAYGIGEGESSKQAMESMTGLFLPITAAWTTIVGASFGVNVSNNMKDAKNQK